MTSFRNEAILVEHTEVWDLKRKEQEDHSCLAHEFSKHIPCAIIPASCTKKQAGDVSQSQEHEAREAGPQQRDAGQGQ